ncbi:MAG: carboxylate--amine ligase [Nanoarchaeota archaeon]|nr:carboxylate--amine ligase [Nanoarchaeota archaeon]
MKRILVTGSGGAPTLNFVRSLRDADPKREKYYIVGIDCDEFTIHRSECDKTYICPKANDKKYITFLKHIISTEKIDFIHTQPEVEVFTVGKHREEITTLGCKLFMPKQSTIEILRDKAKSYKVWKEAGITVPENIEINSEEDLRRAYEHFGKDNIWIRETIGAAGKGSLSRPDFLFAKQYIESRNAWGKTVAAEHLTARTTTWQSLWDNGKLVAGQGRERKSWEMGNRTQSGVTGLTGTGEIVNDPAIAELATKCILTVDKDPHGIFSVDFTYDAKGVPNPTEINIGKFFTTHYFITRTGCNMPEILVNLAFGEYTGQYNVIDPCEEGYCWVRGMDVLPVLVKKEAIKQKKEEYLEIMRHIS